MEIVKKNLRNRKLSLNLGFVINRHFSQNIISSFCYLL